MKVDFATKERPKLSDPILICGLPGSALVGKVALDHLIATLPAALLAEIYCDGISPQVFVEEDGTVSMMKNEIYFWKASRSSKRDLILYTGDAQPSVSETEYALSEKIMDFARKEHGARDVITLGAYVTGTYTQSPQVYAAVTDATLSGKILSFGCKMMTEGAITGMNGLLLGVAKIKGMSGYALLGETSGYAIDPKASEALLAMISKITGISVDMKELEERAKEAQAILRTVESWRRQESEEESQQGEEKKPGYIT